MARSKLFTENVRMAFETLRTHKVRSFLTVLGVFIGTTVAILVASVLIGFQNNVTDSLNEFGVNNIWIFRFNFGFHVGRMSMEERTRKPISYEDGMAIKEECPAIKNVSISAFPRQAQQQPIRTLLATPAPGRVPEAPAAAIAPQSFPDPIQPVRRNGSCCS